MPDAYRDLLESTIHYLEDLKRQGVRYVTLQSDALERLTQPPPGKKGPARSAVGSSRPSPVGSAPTKVHAGSGAQQTQMTEVDADAGVRVSPEPISDPASGETRSREQAMAELREKALACQRCPHLVASRRQVVFGVGNIEASLMFVGEAPGLDEDRAGEPFVGRAGRLLTRMIQTMGYSRETVYIANVLKCRPDTPAQSFGNRRPTPEEMTTCLPYLVRQIDLIQPRVLVALGSTALEGLTGRNQGISQVRGRFQTFRGIPLMPTYHPSYLLRNQALAIKRQVWEDMLQVLEKLGDPISEKQRNYFLKKERPDARGPG